MADEIDALRMQCFEWLQQRFGSAYMNRQDAIVVPFDRTAVFVAVEQKMVATGRINFLAPVLVDVPLTPPLAHYVAMNGGNLLYGGMSLYQEHEGSTVTVEFDYSMFGEIATQSTVEAAATLVFGSAETEHKKMQPLFGGRSIMDQ